MYMMKKVVRKSAEKGGRNFQHKQQTLGERKRESAEGERKASIHKSVGEE